MTEVLLSPRQQRAKKITQILFALLIIILTIETLILSQLTPLSLAAISLVIAVKVLPLILFIPALRAAKALTPVWLSLLLLPYLCWAVMGLWIPGTEHLFAILRTSIIMLCISAAMAWGWKEKSSRS